MQQKWIENNVDGVTTVARKQVQAAETMIMQEQEDMRNVGKARSTTTKSEIAFEEMLNAIGDSLRNLASSNNDKDWEDEDNAEEDTEHGKLSEDDEPCWAMSTISKMVQHRMESFRQMQMRLDKLMH